MTPALPYLVTSMVKLVTRNINKSFSQSELVFIEDELQELSTLQRLERL